MEVVDSSGNMYGSTGIFITGPDGKPKVPTGGGSPTGPAGGDLNGTYPNPGVTWSNGSATYAALFYPLSSNPSGYLTSSALSGYLTSATAAATYYPLTNPSGYISGITSLMVTTALGYTPYDSTNPSGYITSAALSPYLTSATAAATYQPIGSYLTLSSLTASSPLTYSNTTGAFSIQVATGSQDGYLTSTDWTTFNSKQAALSGTGFVKISGTTISYDNSTYLTTISGITAGGDLQGTYPNPVVHQIQGNAVQNGNPVDQDLLIWQTAGSMWKHLQITSITGYNNTNWDIAYTNRITSLTTTGSSGSATLLSNTLNIPTYTLTGLGGQPQLSGTGFVKISGTTISYDNSTYLTTSSAASTYQPLAANLTSWASVTRASGFDTFVATPSSANLASLLTDKTGTGSAVFGTSPTFTTSIITPLVTGSSTLIINANGGNLTLQSFGTSVQSIAFNKISYTPAAATTGTVNHFAFTVPASTGQTASTNTSNFTVLGNTKTWNAGTITTQYWNYFSANTAAFASASTITNSYALYVEVATAGTNATITNNYAAGFTGDLHITTGGSRLYMSGATNTYVEGLTNMRIKGGSEFFVDIGASVARIRTDGTRTLFTGQNIVLSSAALATNATSGFTYIPTCAGTPTGVPTAYTGTVAMVYDTTNNKLYIYNGAWKASTFA